MGSTARVLAATALTTTLVTVASYALPEEHAATGVGFVFLAAVYVLVLRKDALTIRAYGLSLGGLLEPGAINLKSMLHQAVSALGWACLVAILIFPPFWLGFVLWWQPEQPFAFVEPTSYLDEVLGQLMVIALPEEAFYRGYVQPSLDRAWASKPGKPRRHFNFLGAQVGWSYLATSALFAIGHFLTEPHPQRLAVFFPSLLFCWLRNRTGGVGAVIVLHALANIFSATLGRGYGLFS